MHIHTLYKCQEAKGTQEHKHGISSILARPEGKLSPQFVLQSKRLAMHAAIMGEWQR